MAREAQVAANRRGADDSPQRHRDGPPFVHEAGSGFLVRADRAKQSQFPGERDPSTPTQPGPVCCANKANFVRTRRGPRRPRPTHRAKQSQFPRRGRRCRATGLCPFFGFFRFFQLSPVRLRPEAAPGPPGLCGKDSCETKPIGSRLSVAGSRLLGGGSLFRLLSFLSAMMVLVPAARSGHLGDDDSCETKPIGAEPPQALSSLQ